MQEVTSRTLSGVQDISLHSPSPQGGLGTEELWVGWGCEGSHRAWVYSLKTGEWEDVKAAFGMVMGSACEHIAVVVKTLIHMWIGNREKPGEDQEVEH